jgi:carbon starvation protein
MNALKRQGALISIAIAGALIAWSASRFTQERFGAVALLVAAVSFYYLGARFYSRFIANRVLRLDDGNVTPAHRLRDDRDYMPFRRWTLFGMHFAWIAGPGPLIGPTLAAQFGFLPGFLWIVLGAVLMGCVQDMVILVFSTRRDGMSLARMIKQEVSPFGGFVASVAVLFILEILLGVLALVVVRAIANDAWATFTIFASIPIAFFVGFYMTRIRPGHEGQATAIGVGLLIVATALGYLAADHPAWSAIFKRTEAELGFAVVIYGFLAAALPAWLLLAPRDNISTYLKIGTVFLLAIGILLARPLVHMPAVVHFKDGLGPIVNGGLFPFCFIIIACGAISGFHSLISSGTTPRFVDKETDMRPVGYGAMLTESFVGVMALIAAVTLAPGVYMAINHPPLAGAPAKGKPSPAYVQKITTEINTRYGTTFQVTPDEMSQLAEGVKVDSLYNRAGGAPSLAIGMASIFSGAIGGGLLPFWYHFALMFEAVFILTVLDSGTRVIRFVIQEMLHDLAAMRARRVPSGEQRGHVRIPVWLTSGLGVLGWGFILRWGIVDAQGGTQALFKMFGIANQLLAVIALTLATSIMLKRHRQYAWVTGLPLLVLGAITLTAAFESIFSPIPKIGALAGARDAATRAEAALTPAAQAAATTSMHNAWLTATLSGLLIAFVLTVLVVAAGAAIARLRRPAASLEPAGGG